MIYVLYILLSIVILLAMIVIHELGHYVAGKILKFKINEFSVGFGPKLLQHTNKKTGEKFTLRLVPLGGYCAFEDEEGLNAEKEKEEESKNEGEGIAPPETVFEELAPEKGSEAEKTAASEESSSEAVGQVMPTPIEELREEAKEKPRSFTEEAPWKRIIVLVSGAAFNFISAVIFAFIVIISVGYTVPEVYKLYESDGGTVYASELKEGDKIVAVNGQRLSIMHTYAELTQNEKEGDEYVMTVLRDGEELDVRLTVQRIKNTKEELDYIGLGFTPQNTAVKCGFGYAIKWCVPYAGKLAILVLASLGQLITCRIPITSVSGPVGTIGLMADLGMADMRNFLVLLPLIAANLAIFNILPIPALDGSKVVFTIIEWIRKKPVSRKVENIIHTVGLFVILAFVIIIDLVGVLT